MELPIAILESSYALGVWCVNTALKLAHPQFWKERVAKGEKARECGRRE
jgi:hypothetical protein